MAVYSIKDLERISGIKAHTIRIWEQRYNILEPERTATNIRTYADSDLKVLLNVACLNKKGYKISKLASMSAEDLIEMVESEAFRAEETSIVVEQLFVAMIDMNERYFEEVLQNQIKLTGFDHTAEKVIYPLFERIGVLWQVGTINPGQEHFISNLIRQKIIVAIDSLDLPGAGAPVMLSFLPEWELHELGLLYYTYQAKKAGYHVIYLGQSTPLPDAIDAINRKQPDVILVAFVQPATPEKLTEYINELSGSAGKSSIWLSGNAVSKFEPTAKNVTILQHVDELRALIQA